MAAQTTEQFGSDFDYLRKINAEDNPAESERLELLIQQGKTADQIAELCDELGRLR